MEHVASKHSLRLPRELLPTLYFAKCSAVLLSLWLCVFLLTTGIAQAAGEMSGTVVVADTAARTLVVRSKGSTITFDLTNPTLKGYASIDEIKTGHSVAVAYTRDGIRVSRISGRAARAATPEQPRAAKQPLTSKRKEPSKAKRVIIGRWKDRSKDDSFDYVDNNKDGKITPVELSVAIPGLTIEQFRQYDKNHDGVLNRSEFSAIKKGGHM